jgi:hypothetical protein
VFQFYSILIVSSKGGSISDLDHIPTSPFKPILPKEKHLPFEDNFVTIKLEADEHGRFGFNVKGGIDLQSPVLVSKVAPNTPAARSTPPIHEGDQVIMINDRDISSLKHEEIVNLIRSSREYCGGELLLTLKLNRKSFALFVLGRN